ncbi:Conserved_hypothetical protein [Hexamita inflata]|uniref:Myb-like DNA-binding domain-containing protein n=1 Tax=Hexamita inflata TaxID=28002 RepID=A0AA86UPX5_9EUKA|nr:Conserved hypothetical protein [Hexamita inflata]
MSERTYSKWSPEEKDKLITQITKQKSTGLKLDWLQIQSYVETKTIRQCYDQYVLLFKKPHKTDSRHMWTVQEEMKLVNVFKQNPYKWELIQNQFPNLNIVQLKNKVNTFIKQQDEYFLKDIENANQTIGTGTEKSENKILLEQLGKLLGM